MAKKSLKSVSLVLNYENGVNYSGKVAYKKKTYSNVKTSAESAAILSVADAIKGVMSVAVSETLITESSSLTNE